MTGDPLLAAVALVHLGTAAAFLAVGHRFRARQVDVGLTLPRNAFVTWWWGFAGYLGGQGLIDLAAAAGWTSLPVAVAFRLAAGPLIAAAAWGLAFHVVFLWSGRVGWALPLAFYYGAAGSVYAMTVWLHQPVAVVATGWSAELVYVVPLGGLLWACVLASFGLPLVIGSLAYLGLAWKVHERARRYRIVLVGASILLWVSSGYAAETGGGLAVRFAAIVLLGLATAGAVMAAYFPPPAIQRWLARPAR